MVAEDSGILRKVLAKVLEGAGYDVAQAEDGLVAVELCKAFKSQVAIMDLVTPNMGVLDSIMAIREFYTGGRFLVITSSGRTDKVVTVKTLVVSECLLKPVDQGELLNEVSATFEEAHPS